MKIWRRKCFGTHILFVVELVHIHPIRESANYLHFFLVRFNRLPQQLFLFFYRIESIYSPPGTYQFCSSSPASYSTSRSQVTNMAGSLGDVHQQHRWPCCHGISPPFIRDMVPLSSTHNINCTCVTVFLCWYRDGIYCWPTVSS